MNSKLLIAVGAGLIMLGSVAAASAKPNQAFLTDTIQGNLAEISMGQLAQKTAAMACARSGRCSSRITQPPMRRRHPSPRRKA